MDAPNIIENQKDKNYTPALLYELDITINMSGYCSRSMCHCQYISQYHTYMYTVHNSKAILKIKSISLPNQ